MENDFNNNEKFLNKDNHLFPLMLASLIPFEVRH